MYVRAAVPFMRVTALGARRAANKSDVAMSTSMPRTTMPNLKSLAMRAPYRGLTRPHPPDGRATSQRAAAPPRPSRLPETPGVNRAIDRIAAAARPIEDGHQTQTHRRAAGGTAAGLIGTRGHPS